MSFFFQALQRAVGTEQPKDQAAGEAAPITGETPSASTVFHAPATTVAAAAESSPLAAPARPRHSISMEKLPEMMVAGVLSADLPMNVAAYEQCRVLRTRLQEVMRTRPMQTLMLTSATAGEGKTLLSANLAMAMSQLERFRVLLVDVDLRKGGVAQFFKLDVEHGLNTYLLNNDSLADICWYVNPNLSIVPTGQMRENSAEILNGSRMAQFLKEAAQEFDLLILDAPPVFPIADAQVLVRMVDGVLLVTHADQSPFSLVGKAAELMKSKLIGGVLNATKHLGHKGYAYDYYYSKPGKSNQNKWSRS